MIDRRLPYQIACNIYNQGIECDNAARIIRERLPEFLLEIRKSVRVILKKDYKKEWETPIQYEP